MNSWANRMDDRLCLTAATKDTLVVLPAVKYAHNHHFGFLHHKEDCRSSLKPESAKSRPKIIPFGAAIGKCLQSQAGCLDTVDVRSRDGAALLPRDVAIERNQVGLSAWPKADSIFFHLPRPWLCRAW